MSVQGYHMDCLKPAIKVKPTGRFVHKISQGNSFCNTFSSFAGGSAQPAQLTLASFLPLLLLLPLLLVQRLTPKNKQTIYLTTERKQYQILSRTNNVES